jgi:hypothetical protein
VDVLYGSGIPKGVINDVIILAGEFFAPELRRLSDHSPEIFIRSVLKSAEFRPHIGWIDAANVRAQAILQFVLILHPKMTNQPIPDLVAPPEINGDPVRFLVVKR